MWLLNSFMRARADGFMRACADGFKRARTHGRSQEILLVTLVAVIFPGVEFKVPRPGATADDAISK